MCDNLTGASDQLKMYCSCKQAVDSLASIADKYITDRATYMDDIASYNRFLAVHQDWVAKTGDFSKYKTYGVSDNVQIDWDSTIIDSGARCRGCAKRTIEDGWWVDQNNHLSKNIGLAGQDARCNQEPGTPLQGYLSY